MIRNILRLSRFEIKRSRITYDRRVLIFLIPSLILILLFFFLYLKSGAFFQNEFYTVYEESGNLEPIMGLSGKFMHHPYESGADIHLISGNSIFVFSGRSLRARAATEAFTKAVKDYNMIIFSEFPEEERFPVLIETVFTRQNETDLIGTAENITLGELNQAEESVEEMERRDSLPDSVSIGDTADGVTSEILPETGQGQGLPPVSDGEVEDVFIPSDGAVFDEGDASGFDNDPELNIRDVEAVDKTFLDSLDEENLKTPSQLSPALPFEPIYMALSMIVVLTFVALLFSNRVYDEKVNKKGTLLLISPTSNAEIIVGKTLPHLIIGLIITFAITLFKTTSPLSLIMLFFLLSAIILVYLSISFLIAILARSFKELSFIGIFAISLYSLFLLIPAFMISFSEASLASPLTVVVKLLLEESVSFGLFMFALVPQVIMGLLVFFIGSLIFTGEDLFSYKGIFSKIIDTYENYLKRPYYLIYTSIATIPFVFIIELLFVVVLISVKSDMVLPVVLFCIAFIEELFKGLGLYAVHSRQIFKTGFRQSVLFGVFTGVGFFLGEKVSLLLTISSFVKEYALLVIAGLMVPLLLHVILSVFISVGLYKAPERHRKKAFFFLVLVASIIHFSINYMVIRGAGL